MSTHPGNERGGQFRRARGDGHDDHADDEITPSEYLRHALSAVDDELSSSDQHDQADEQKDQGFSKWGGIVMLTTFAMGPCVGSCVLEHSEHPGRKT